MRACRCTVDDGGKQAAMPRQGAGCMTPLTTRARRRRGDTTRRNLRRGVGPAIDADTRVVRPGLAGPGLMGGLRGRVWAGKLVGQLSQPPMRGFFLLALSGPPPSVGMSHRVNVGADSAVLR